MTTHPTPEAPSDGLIEAYVPVAIHFEEVDTLDFVTRDVPTFSLPVYAGMDVLHDAQNREPIGWRIYGWSRIAPKSEALTQAAARIQVLEGELETARHAAIILHGDAEAVATYRLLRRERDAAQSERTVSEIRAQALESENGRMREALSFYRDSWTVPAQGPRNYPEPNMHLARDAGSFAANVLSALTGETA